MEDYLPVSKQLTILFDAVQHAEKRPFTLQEVSDATGISVGTLSQLRTGRIENPQLNTLREICRFFDVPLRYFEAQNEDQCYAFIQDNDRDKHIPELSEIAFRATNLSPDSQRDLLKIIKWVQAAEAQRKAGLEMPPLPGLESYDDD
ncbi:MAG: helix-turn-helix transcriptional regulator [Phototrophicaceae bacterium]